MKFLKTFIIVFFISAVGVGIYNQVSKEDKVPGKVTRLECMKKVTSFERGYGIEDILDAQAQLAKGNFTLKSDIQKSQYMNSTLFDNINMHIIDQKVLKELKTYSKGMQNINDEKVKIEYTVFENDKEDPKKKSSKCKLYRGYVVLKVKNKNNKTVYQNQIDFWDPKGKDVADTVKCGILGFTTFK
jgi:hypothetical protein